MKHKTISSFDDQLARDVEAYYGTPDESEQTEVNEPELSEQDIGELSEAYGRNTNLEHWKACFFNEGANASHGICPYMPHTLAGASWLNGYSSQKESN